MEVNRPLEYAPPLQPRRRLYWVVLLAAWIASLPLVSFLDQFLKSHVYGGSADGGATILAMPAVIPALIAAVFTKRRLWIAAILGGVCSPLAITAMYLLWR